MAPPKSKFELTGSAYPMETASFSRYWPKSVEPVTGVGSGQGPQGAQGPRTRQLERLEMDFNGFRTDFNGFCLLFFLHCPLLAGWAVVL